MNKLHQILCILLSTLILNSSPVLGALLYTFESVSENAPASSAIAENQIVLTVTQPSAGQVKFELSNTGPQAAVIANVYFDDTGPPLLIGPGTASESDNKIVFQPGGSPPNLPAGNEAAPVFTSDLRFEAKSPPSKKGVNPGGWVGFTFEIADESGYNDVVDALGSGELRVGVHVISIGASETSESLVNMAPSPATTTVFLITGVFAALNRSKYRV